MALEMIPNDLEEMSREGASSPDAKRQKTSYVDSRECSNGNPLLLCELVQTKRVEINAQNE